MKIEFETSAKLNQDQLFSIIKEGIEKKTGKQLCNIYWNETDGGMTCELMFRNEITTLEMNYED